MRKLDGETCFNLTTLRGCMIPTNYIHFSSLSSFCPRGVISVRELTQVRVKLELK